MRVYIDHEEHPDFGSSQKVWEYDYERNHTGQREVTSEELEGKHLKFVGIIDGMVVLEVLSDVE